MTDALNDIRSALSDVWHKPDDCKHEWVSNHNTDGSSDHRCTQCGMMVCWGSLKMVPRSND